MAVDLWRWRPRLNLLLLRNVSLRNVSLRNTDTFSGHPAPDGPLDGGEVSVPPALHCGRGAQRYLADGTAAGPWGVSIDVP